MCVSGIDFVSVSMIFRKDFGIILTVIHVYICFSFFSLHINSSTNVLDQVSRNKNLQSQSLGLNKEN
jgi:hypothetical protein